MTLQQMRYFLAVAQEASFSRAAQQHYISQTAVSQQIKLLEEELQVPLFVRSYHTVQLTAAGQIFYDYVVRILDLTEQAAAHTRAAKPEFFPPIEIGIMSGLEQLPIMEDLLRFKENFPGIPLHFHFGIYPEFRKMLLQKELDLALILEIMPLQEGRDLVSVPVAQLQQYVVLNRQSRLAGYVSLRQEQLRGERYSVLRLDRELWGQLSAKLERQGIDTRTPRLADSLEELVLQIAFDGGYALLAEPVIAQLPANKNLAFVPLENDHVPALALWNPEHISASGRKLLTALHLAEADK